MTPPATVICRTLFIVDSRAWFAGCRARFDPAQDVVLTYDFALRHTIVSEGGRAWYVDHLRTQTDMQAHNFAVYEFFRTWHLDRDGRDIFEWAGVAFGMSFRLVYWNELLFQMRARLCLHALRGWRFERVECGTSLGIVESILTTFGIPFAPVAAPAQDTSTAYYFPIHAWMQRHIGGQGWRAHATAALGWVSGACFAFWDRWRWWETRPLVFVQDYHPTRPVLARLRRDACVRILETTASSRVWWRRFVRVRRDTRPFVDAADRLLDDYRRRRVARLRLDDEDVSDIAHGIVGTCVAPRVAASLARVDSLSRDIAARKLSLMVLVANIGDVVSELDCVCRAKGVPTYLIANGLLGPAFLDEAKYGTVINGYGPAIAADYFRGLDNVISLGDPRMDAYPPVPARGPVPRDRPLRVSVGASGHSNIDLNSYVAVEFEFLHDVVTAVRRVRDDGRPVEVDVKVRANGYRRQYDEFVREYAPDLNIRIVNTGSMRDLLERADVFISLYSQTLFEASCLGIPVICYRNDREVMGTPFDGRSPLVSVDNVHDLAEAIGQAADAHPRFAAFLDRGVMARYVGSLDGGSTDRNVRQIYEMAGIPVGATA